MGSAWPGPGPHGAACVVPDLSGLRDAGDLQGGLALECLHDTWPQPAPKSSLKLVTRGLKRSVSFFSLMAPSWLARAHVGDTEAGAASCGAPLRSSQAGNSGVVPGETPAQASPHGVPGPRRALPLPVGIPLPPLPPQRDPPPVPARAGAGNSPGQPRSCQHSRICPPLSCHT